MLGLHRSAISVRGLRIFFRAIPSIPTRCSTGIARLSKCRCWSSRASHQIARGGLPPEVPARCPTPRRRRRSSGPAGPRRGATARASSAARPVTGRRTAPRLARSGSRSSPAPRRGSRSLPRTSAPPRARTAPRRNPRRRRRRGPTANQSSRCVLRPPSDASTHPRGNASFAIRVAGRASLPLPPPPPDAR